MINFTVRIICGGGEVTFDTSGVNLAQVKVSFEETMTDSSEVFYVSFGGRAVLINKKNVCAIDICVSVSQEMGLPSAN